MHRFDPQSLKQKLEALPHVSRVAFALACADRLAEFLGNYIEPAIAARNVARQFVLGSPVASPELAELAATLEGSPLLDCDDVAASAYLLDCLRTNDPQAAVWTAQRAYDARDLAAQEAMSISTYTPEIEATLLASPAVQAELASQITDINELIGSAGAAGRIASRAIGGTHA
jgi:hypothetical protein